MTEERTSIRGVVETVFYSGPTFSAGRLRTAIGRPFVKFAGKVFARENDAVRLEGHWTNHPKYGRQFEADFMGLTWRWTRMGWRTSWPITRT
jgi:exodeoxyribonuclease V alpha subunit